MEYIPCQKFYAHSVEGNTIDKWQPMDIHLLNVAKLAKEFADEFGSGEWAYLAGLWHDIGKYSKDFQEMLLASVDANIERRARGIGI